MIFYKDSDENLDYLWEWADWLTGADTIDTYEVELVSGDVVIGSHFTDGESVTVWISGGTINSVAVVLVRVTTVAGRISEKSATFEISIPSYDWVTLLEAKRVISAKMTASNLDETLSSVISAFSRRLDRAVGPAVQRIVTGEVHSGGGRSIELRQGPIVSVSSVQEYDGSSSITLSANSPGSNPSDGYSAPAYLAQPELNLKSGILYRTRSGHRTNWVCQDENIVVSYVAGRYSDTSTVDPRFKQAISVCIKNWWRMYEISAGSQLGGQFDQPMQSFPTFDIPNAARNILRDIWKPNVGFGAG